MKVLVTGATGFTGGHLARRLRAHGDTVRVMVRDVARAESLAAAGCAVVATLRFRPPAASSSSWARSKATVPVRIARSGPSAAG